VTPELIDGIETLLREAIKTAKDASAKAKIQAGLDRIDDMKRQEKDEREKEKQDAEKSVLGNINL
jgi:ElaB/YqjD/DUF883 family membrane-anchored ribosome-binding protein